MFFRDLRLFLEKRLSGIRLLLVAIPFIFSFQSPNPWSVTHRPPFPYPLSVTHKPPPTHRTDSLPKVKPIDLSTIDPNLFTKEEWFVPYYLKHFSRVANSVIESGPNKGFINISVWRTPDVNHPYNARIMESILSLAWFYTQDRPWNPYYADPALRVRLEAALAFWCSIQNEEGRFSEYAPEKYSVAPTAFATKFIGKALYILSDGPEVDPELMERARKCLRKALHYSFSSDSSWKHGRNFTNQYANLWGGAMMYLELWPDQELENLLHERVKQSMKEFQSPCGYFYEKNGPDWGYNLSTHHSDLHVAWHFAKDAGLEDCFVTKTRDWYEWFSYNAVKEPGREVYFLNKEVETRQNHWGHKVDTLDDPSRSRWTPQAELIPVAMPFQSSREQHELMVEEKYNAMRDKYPEVDDLTVGEFRAFSPYAFLHNDLIQWFPTEGQKKGAIAELPYLKSEDFAQVRVDERNQTNHTFVRRPSYYAIFNGGKIIIDEVQRFGLGLLWNPKLGTVLQSQSRSNDAVWGTRSSGRENVYEAGDLQLKISSAGNELDLKGGIHSLDYEHVEIAYSLGSSGSKSILFGKDKMKVTIKRGGDFSEVFPLLVADDATVKIGDNQISLRTKEGAMFILFKSLVKIEERGDVNSMGGKTCRIFQVKASDELEYEFSFE